jgi:hypothetical protein
MNFETLPKLMKAGKLSDPFVSGHPAHTHTQRPHRYHVHTCPPESVACEPTHLACLCWCSPLVALGHPNANTYPAVKW